MGSIGYEIDWKLCWPKKEMLRGKGSIFIIVYLEDKMGLKDALDKLNNAIDDLTSLHVQTFTGEVTFVQEGKTFNDVRTAIETARGESKISLVAESVFKFDGDSYNFVTSQEGGVPSSALELHKASVDSGIKTRQGLMQMVKGIFD